MLAGCPTAGERSMRVVRIGHEEEGLPGGLGHREEILGETSINGWIAAPSVFVAYTLPSVSHGPAENLLLAKGLADNPTLVPRFVEDCRQRLGAGTNPLKTFSAVIGRIQTAEQYAS